jgi:NADPH:quinone reductase-like Zn-dependent oxidoreductase
MRAARLHPPGDIDSLAVDQIEAPRPRPGEALVRVRAAGITRDELDWPTQRLPAIVSYELSGVVEEIGDDVVDVAVGDEVFGLTAFDRDGVAADLASVPSAFLAPKPSSLSHVETAALPLAGLTAWQGLFVQGELRGGETVLIIGAAGGVGHLATQLARWRGATVIAVASAGSADLVRALGANLVIDRAARFEEGTDPVDVVFDTIGGDLLVRSADVLRDGGRLVAVAEEPPPEVAKRVRTSFFVVEPDRSQLVQLATLVTDGKLLPAIDSVFALEDARSAFDRVMAPGKHGKVVIDVDA